MKTGSAVKSKALVSRLWRSRWLQPLNDVQAWDGLFSALNPMWSRRDFPARVVRVSDETADTRTFVLRVSRRWPGHRAGQHVVLEVEIEGRRLHRTFSISSAPGSNRELSLTIKRQPGARVSSWMHQELKVGSVVRLSAPAGNFLLPELADGEALLMLSAGSGITPLLAMLDALAATRHSGTVTLIHSCRSPDDLIGAERLRALAHWPALRLELQFSTTTGRLDAARIRQLVPDFDRQRTLVCGPAGFIAMVEALYAAAGASGRLSSESFSGRVLAVSDAGQTPQPISCRLTKQVFTARPGHGLLAEAEAAGLKPAHGCRIGICKSCQCRKHSGTVENLRTGEISSEPDELIQLCVSVARSPLVLAL